RCAGDAPNVGRNEGPGARYTLRSLFQNNSNTLTNNTQLSLADTPIRTSARRDDDEKPEREPEVSAGYCAADVAGGRRWPVGSAGGPMPPPAGRRGDGSRRTRSMAPRRHW